MEGKGGIFKKQKIKFNDLTKNLLATRVPRPFNSKTCFNQKRYEGYGNLSEMQEKLNYRRNGYKIREKFNCRNNGYILLEIRTKLNCRNNGYILSEIQANVNCRRKGYILSEIRTEINCRRNGYILSEIRV